jgi:antitoxin component YwqK of YwqJK toxin-antitoxin module
MKRAFLYQASKQMKKHLFTLKYVGIILLCSLFYQIPIKADQTTSTTEITKRSAVYSEGLYFTDDTQTELYTGFFREYYESGDLKLEVFLQNGRPEGTYVVYFPNARTKEVRAYRKGIFHGIWRTYNESGMLIAQAEYADGLKDGSWMIWDENGIRRYEMHYLKGKKTGVWYMWDEKGVLLSEKEY